MCLEEFCVGASVPDINIADQPADAQLVTPDVVLYDFGLALGGVSGAGAAFPCDELWAFEGNPDPYAAEGLHAECREGSATPDYLGVCYWAARGVVRKYGAAKGKSGARWKFRARTFNKRFDYSGSAQRGRRRPRKGLNIGGVLVACGHVPGAALMVFLGEPLQVW